MTKTITNQQPNPDDLIKIAIVYKKSFGGEPWNEGFKCPRCEEVYPLNFEDKFCSSCRLNSKKVLLVEFWPIETIISDFKSQMEKSGAVYVTTGDADNIYGFAWGYDISSNPEIDSYLDAPGLSSLVDGLYFYLDECAVSPDRQGEGLGKELVKQIFAKQLRDQVLLRTKDNSRMCNLIKSMGGETILSISDDRVIMKLKVR